MIDTIEVDEESCRGALLEELIDRGNVVYILSVLVRQQLKGIDYYGVDLMNGWSKEKEKQFLQDIADLKNNKAYQKIVRFLIKHQIDFTAKEAVDMDEIMFGRATINGITLFKEEVDKWYAEWEKRNEAQGEYNKQAVFDNN